jgi:hypothetical protein
MSREFANAKVLTNFRQTIETLLQYVPPRHLVGLKTIVLTNPTNFQRLIVFMQCFVRQSFFDASFEPSN